MNFKQEIDLMISTYRKLRKPNESDVDSLFRKILLITFIVGGVGVIIVLLSTLFDKFIKVIL